MVEEFLLQRKNSDEQILMKAIHDNYEKQNVKYRISVQKAKMDKSLAVKRKETINVLKNVVIMFLGIVLLICLIFLLNKEEESFMDDCLQAGNSRYVCEKGR